MSGNKELSDFKAVSASTVSAIIVQEKQQLSRETVYHATSE